MLDEQKFINKILRSHLLLRLLSFLFLGLFSFFIFHYTQHASASVVMDPPKTIDIPWEDFDRLRSEWQPTSTHEFWKIVNQLKPEPAKVVSRAGSATVATSGVIAEVETAGKLAKFGGRLAGGVGVAATALIFPDNIGYSRYEPVYSGAAKYEYQTPDRSHPQYSSRHSFNKNENVIQYYVRVYSATGSRNHADVYKDLPGLGTIEMTSYERVCMKQYGCGYGNKLVSQAAPNAEGWIYFRDLENQTQVRVQIDTLPKYKNARVGRTIQKFDYKGSHVVYMTYFIDATTNSRSKSRPNPKPKPKPKKNSTSTELGRRKNYVDDKFSELKTATGELDSNIKKLNTLTKKANSQTNKAYEAANKVNNTGNKLYSSGNLKYYNKFKQQAKTADSLYTNAMSSTQEASDTYGDTAGSQKRYHDASLFYTRALRSYNNLITDRTVKNNNNTVINNQNRFAGDEMTSRNKIPGGTLNMQWQYGQQAELLRRRRDVSRAYSTFIITSKVLRDKKAKVDTVNKNMIGVNNNKAVSAYNSASSLYNSTNQLGNRAEFINSAIKAQEKLNSSIKENRKAAKYYDEYAKAQISHSISATRVAKALRFQARMIKNKKQKQNSLNTAKSWNNAASSVMSSNRIIIEERDLYNAEAKRLVISEEDLQEYVDNARSDECVNQQQQENSKTPEGSNSANEGGTIYYYNYYPGLKNYKITLKNVLKNQLGAQPSENSSKKCQDVANSRSIVVHFEPKTLAGFADSIEKLRVKLTEGVRCKNGQEQRINAKSQVEFKGCNRGPLGIELTSTGDYYQVEPIKENSDLGAKIRATGTNDSQNVIINISMFKPYPRTWLNQFKNAATRYWKIRHASAGNILNEDRLLNRIKQEDPKVYENDFEIVMKGETKYEPNRIAGGKSKISKKIVAFPTAICSPSAVALLAEQQSEIGHEAFTLGQDVGGANRPLESGNCRIYINYWPGKTLQPIQVVLTNRQHACILFVHEYGHLLGYPDFDEKHKSASKLDIMWDHAVNILYKDQNAKNAFLYGAGSGCR